MIRLGQLMLYVKDVKAVAHFWVEHLDFKVVGNADGDFIELSDGQDDTTHLVLHNIETVRAMNPEMFLGTPSIMLETNEDIRKLYQQFIDQHITVGPLVTMPGTNKQVFNFADIEDNYYAITEK